MSWDEEDRYRYEQEAAMEVSLEEELRRIAEEPVFAYLAVHGGPAQLAKWIIPDDAQSRRRACSPTTVSTEYTLDKMSGGPRPDPSCPR